MKISQEILIELKVVSPLLAGMEKVNVFQVPEGYFSELHQRIADYSILNNTSAVDNTNKRNLQQVPQGYFDSLSDSILDRVKAVYNETTGEALDNFSPILHSLKSKNVFSVPDNYFDTLSDSIFAKAKASDFENAKEELYNLSPMLFSLKGENVFSIPFNFFDTLGESVLDRVKTAFTETAEEEIRGLSPILYSLRGEKIFSVPDNYFKSFADNVTKKLKPQPAKVVSMNSKKSWWKYAAAAVVTGIVAISSLQIFIHVSDKNENVATAYIKASFQYKTEDDLTAGIAKLNDADIIKYLEKNGNVMDNELLTNNTDVSEMPSQTDYLNDENTLNEYLDKIDAQTDNKSNP
jgi:hypothetical protein